VTVSDHSFQISMQENGHNVSKYDGKVWHPDDSTTRNGQVVGNVVQTYPELDLSVKLNVQCTNSIYFMAERPVKFLKFDEVKFGDLLWGRWHDQWLHDRRGACEIHNP
jgi:hypothetical protein